MKVNFVNEFNLFMRYARNNSLSIRERMFWLALFYIANDRAIWDEQAEEYEWPEDYFGVSNGELNLYCCFDKRGIDTTRNQLKQRGLIDFTPGDRNKKTPRYKINYLSVIVGYKKAPNNNTNDTPKHDPNDMTNDAPKHDTRNAPFYINKITNIENDISTEEDEEEISPSTRARRADIRKSAEDGFREHLGRECTPRESKRITDYCCMAYTLIEPEAVKYSLSIAARYGAKAPAEYALTVLDEWRREYISTEEEAMNYMSFKRAAQGRDPLIDQEQAKEWMRTDYERRHEACLEKNGTA